MAALAVEPLENKGNHVRGSSNAEDNIRPTESLSSMLFGPVDTMTLIVSYSSHAEHINGYIFSYGRWRRRA